MKRIYMIDCPGIVPPNQGDSDESLLLRGSIRVENVDYPAQYIEAVLSRVQPKHVQRTYELKDYTDATSFLELLARKGGRLLKGGEPDLDGCAKIVINDWIRGKLPWFTPPPMKDGEAGGPVRGVEGREGKLGEMSKKRKRDDASQATPSVAAATEPSSTNDDDDEFEGFSDEDGGLELDVGDDSDDNDENDTEANSSVTGTGVEEDDEEVEEEVLAIGEALSTAKREEQSK
jgi:nuclear GTP-binding protein